MGRKCLKQNIINAVFTVAAKDGLENTTTRKISRAADTSEVSIYNNFENKEELLSEAFASVNKELDEHLRKSYEAEYGWKEVPSTEKLGEFMWTSYLNYWLCNKDKTLFYDSYSHSSYINDDTWIKQNVSFAFFTGVFGKLLGEIYRATTDGGFTFIWLLIMESALGLAKRSIKYGMEITEQARTVIAGLLKTFLALGKENAMTESGNSLASMREKL